MPKKKFLPNADHYYHVSARCINKEWFSLPIDQIWKIFSEYLFFIKHGFNVKIYSFVLMNNHFHLIIQTPDANLDQAMNYFMRETSRTISYLSGRINQVYGGPYHWSIITNDIYFLHAYKYVYRNPVESSLIDRVEDYPFSTIFSKIGKKHTLIPLVEDLILFPNVDETLTWLNTKYPSLEIKNVIKKGLRKNEFKFPRNKSSQKHELEIKLV